MSARNASTFDLLPAIDLRGGRVVRLRQGDFEREDVFGEDPAVIARSFADAGAEWIHVVDLDGARGGERRQARTIEAVGAALATHPGHPRLQVAGGLRTSGAIDAVLGAGADRVVLGTAALTDPELVIAAIARHGPDRVAVALDVRDGQAVGDGWVAGARGAPALEGLERLSALGVTTFVVTAIAHDGLLGGPDLELLRSCLARTDASIVASGGISTVEDIAAVRSLGCGGAIVGRALYEGSLDLATALRAAAGG